MDRRETIKTLFIGAVSGSVIATSGCNIEGSKEAESQPSDSSTDEGYGRTPEEKKRDQKLYSETYFQPHEMATIALLCDIILPADDKSGSATQAAVPDFIEFIAKDMPYHQVPLRGGLMWLDHEANKRFGKVFKDCTNQDQLSIIDDIAYPDRAKDKPELAPGVKFFTNIRNLTLTGFYTSKMGVIDDLGYQGNRPNVWDGVPEEVLQEHGVAYEPEWLAKCIDQSTREQLAQWDDKGNLVS